MIVRTVPAVVVFATLALGVAACDGAAAESTPSADVGEADVTVVADDVVFVDPPTELVAGTSVVAIDNQGQALHDLTVEGVEGATVSADGGEAAARSITLEPGVYTVYCSVSGHRSAGMEFEVSVG